MMTCYNVEIDRTVLIRYISGLINRFYKILPLREEGEPTLRQYQESLLREMLGCQSLVVAMKDDDRYMSLLAILQYMIDHEPDVPKTKAEVFRAINILRQLQRKYDFLKE